MALPGREALDVILESLTPARLIQSLAEEDFFWLLQDIGPEDALPILARASNDQWQYLLDIELWHKDRLSNNSVNQWLDLLMKADPQRFVVWGLNNTELIELHLLRNINVRIREENESPSDFGDDYFSLDDVFYVRVQDEKNHETIRELLERLAEYDLKKYHDVLLEMGGLPPAETEENMYRLRNVRLAEKGFLPFEDAVGIYQRLSPENLLEKEPDNKKDPKKWIPLQVVPVSSSLLIKDEDLFYAALKYIEDDYILEQLQMEFAAMCNQIMSADSRVARDKDDLATVVRKACGYLDIGLQKLADGEPQEAARFVSRFSLDKIFRVGYGSAVELQWKAKKWIKTSWFVAQDLDLGFWEEDWEGMLDGLLKKRPLFFTGFSEGGELHREFKSLEETSRYHEALDRIVALDSLLSLVFAPSFHVGHIEAYQPLNYRNLLLTCWARHHLRLDEKIEPLAIGQLKAFFQMLWAAGEKPNCVNETMKQSFLDWLTVRSSLAASEILGGVGAVLESLFEQLEKEYGPVSLEDLDPRYIKHFLVAL